MELILTGTALPATQFSAHIPGLHVLPTTEVLSAAKACAKQIAGNSAPVVALAKHAILTGNMHPRCRLDLERRKALTEMIAESRLESGLAIERKLYCSSLDLHDKTEGIGVFLGK